MDKKQQKKDEQIEREATCFAMCLLMPKKFIIKEVKALGGINLVDDEQIKQLAIKFKVPISTMAIRLSQIYSRDGKKN